MMIINMIYIIGAVCVSQKSLFSFSRDFVVSPVSGHFRNSVTPPLPYSKDLVFPRIHFGPEVKFAKFRKIAQIRKN